MHRRSCLWKKMSVFPNKDNREEYFHFGFNIAKCVKCAVVLSQKILFLCFDQIVILKLIAPLASVTPQLQNKNQRKVLNFGILCIFVASFFISKPHCKIHIYAYSYIAMCLYMNKHRKQIVFSCFCYCSVYLLYQ